MIDLANVWLLGIMYLFLIKPFVLLLLLFLYHSCYHILTLVHYNLLVYNKRIKACVYYAMIRLLLVSKHAFIML